MKNGVFFRKIFLLSSILVVVLIIIVTTYVTTYTNNKVDSSNIYQDQVETLKLDEDYTWASNEEFLNLFSTFNVYKTKMSAPYYDQSGALVNGSITLKCENTLKDGSMLKNNSFDMVLRLGASWIGYKSNTSSTQTVSVNKEKTGITISSLDQVFPTNGPLWFTGVDNPTLYVLVRWTTTLGSVDSAKYTILEYSYNQYMNAPVVEE